MLFNRQKTSKYTHPNCVLGTATAATGVEPAAIAAAIVQITHTKKHCLCILCAATAATGHRPAASAAAIAQNTPSKECIVFTCPVRPLRPLVSDQQLSQQLSRRAHKTYIQVACPARPLRPLVLNQQLSQQLSCRVHITHTKKHCLCILCAATAATGHRPAASAAAIA